MKTHYITNGGSRAEVLEDGAYVRSLSLSNNPILAESTDGFKTHGGLSILIPYADIVYRATYGYRGITYHLPKNAGYEGDYENSIHGLTNELRWKVISEREDSIRLAIAISDEGYPSVLKAVVSYSIRAGEFRVGIAVKNTGTAFCPVMCGSHPYFRSSGIWSIECNEPIVGLSGITNKDVQPERPVLHACESYNISRKEGRKYDDSFFGGGRLLIRTESALLEMIRREMPFFSVYDGQYAPPDSFSLVPMTAAPNAYNNRFGLKELSPGESFRCGFSIRLMSNRSK